ncbi:MAG: hypothetical protein ACR2OZ_06055 [Verrucomicrobiales bacterium]
MWTPPRVPRPTCLAALLFGLAGLNQHAAAQFANFETRHTRPLVLSPDGKRLFALNTPDARLSVFDISNPANAVPVLIREIAVGVEPVSVNVRSADEAWVVNEVSEFETCQNT